MSDKKHIVEAKLDDNTKHELEHIMELEKQCDHMREFIVHKVVEANNLPQGIYNFQLKDDDVYVVQMEEDEHSH